MNNLDLRTLVLGKLNTNCYLLTASSSLDTVIIDPGDDADYVMEIIAENQLSPQAIIATHGHFDHVLGVTQLQLTYNIPFYISKKDVFLLNQAKNSAQYFTGNLDALAPKANGYLSDNATFPLASYQLQVVPTPGHTPGSISLYVPDYAWAFVGDLLFWGGGMGRTDFSYSDHEQLLKSIAKVMTWPDTTILFPGHGPNTTVGEEKKIKNLRALI